jgi:hypothetical protein
MVCDIMGDVQGDGRSRVSGKQGASERESGNQKMTKQQGGLQNRNKTYSKIETKHLRE